MPSKIKSNYATFYFGAISLSGIFLFAEFIGKPSEAGNQFLFGLSLVRFLIAGVFILLLSISLLVTIASITRLGSWQEALEKRLFSFLSSKERLNTVLTLIYVNVLLMGGLLVLTLLPVAEWAVSYVGIIVRVNSLLAWILLASIFLGLLLANSYKEILNLKNFFSPYRVAVWFVLFLAVYIFLIQYYREAAYVLSLKHFEPPLRWLGAFVLVWALISGSAVAGRYQAVLNRFLFLFGIFLIAFVLYTHLATWVDWVHKGRYQYWSALAGQFIQGKLYMPDPAKPNLTHDLTFYNGKWYVPNPPLPAVVLMPLAFFVGPENIQMGEVSIFFSAVNIVLVYLILEQLIKRRWVRISQSSALWLVLLFGFGTNHLWVGINGGVWFVSQILTLTFLALAVFSALKEWSPWMIGLCVGLAIAARPNSIMTWPFVFAIAMQILRENDVRIDLRQMLTWSIKSALPIALTIAGLLIYNYARFDNFMDFGYTAINGDPTIVKNAQTYGLFSTRYLWRNLEVMFFYLPKIQWGNIWLFSPGKAGMSVFLSTPPLIYLIHRYEKKWWILGAWTAIFFNFALLMLYHNTGSDQFGYRYILDMIIPILALMAYAFKEKIRWHFFVLLILSVVSNIYGAAWFMNG